MRARNLTKPCKGKVANPRALSRLSQGKHPYDGKNLVTAPRRMTVDDVGYASKEQGSWSDGSVTGCEREVLPTPPAQSIGQHCGIACMLVCVCNRRAQMEPSSDEDVFGFGGGIDEA